MAPAADDGADDGGTENMGCGNSFKGGRCADGSDVVNCVYANPTNKGADKCSGTMKLLKIPEANLCKDQRGMFKCVLVKYEAPDECVKSCPGACKDL